MLDHKIVICSEGDLFSGESGIDVGMLRSPLTRGGRGRICANLTTTPLRVPAQRRLCA